MPSGTSAMPGLATAPVSWTSVVPGVRRCRRSSAKAFGPLPTIHGTTASVSTLLTTVGRPYRPLRRWGTAGAARAGRALSCEGVEEDGLLAQHEGRPATAATSTCRSKPRVQRVRARCSRPPRPRATAASRRSTASVVPGLDRDDTRGGRRSAYAASATPSMTACGSSSISVAVDAGAGIRLDSRWPRRSARRSVLRAGQPPLVGRREAGAAAAAQARTGEEPARALGRGRRAACRHAATRRRASAAAIPSSGAYVPAAPSVTQVQPAGRGEDGGIRRSATRACPAASGELLRGASRTGLPAAGRRASPRGAVVLAVQSAGSSAPSVRRRPAERPCRACLERRRGSRPRRSSEHDGHRQIPMRCAVGGSRWRFA